MLHFAGAGVVKTLKAAANHDFIFPKSLFRS